MSGKAKRGGGNGGGAEERKGDDGSGLVLFMAGGGSLAVGYDVLMVRPVRPSLGLGLGG